VKGILVGVVSARHEREGEVRESREWFEGGGAGF